MRFLILLIWLGFSCATWAGQLQGDIYVGERFGHIEIRLPTSHWLILDREFSGNNEYGGPVAEIRAIAPVASVFPSFHLSAFKRAEASVTADFVLQTSRDAVMQKGGEPSGIEVRAVNGKKIWFFEARVKQQDHPACLSYALMEGASAYFALQTVVPCSSMSEVRRLLDGLLPRVSY